MFISPKVAIENGWVKYETKDKVLTSVEQWEEAKFVSPNAIDFTLDKVFTIEDRNPFYISEDGKQMRGGVELTPMLAPLYSDNQQMYWKLDTGVYDGASNFYVDIPEGVAALLIVRSTFNRNGLFITSGLYDSLYTGNIGMAIHNRSGVAFISPGTRIGQIIFVHSDSVGGYTGEYNTQPGQHWSEAVKK